MDIEGSQTSAARAGLASDHGKFPPAGARFLLALSSCRRRTAAIPLLSIASPRLDHRRGLWLALEIPGRRAAAARRRSGFERAGRQAILFAAAPAFGRLSNPEPFLVSRHAECRSLCNKELRGPRASRLPFAGQAAPAGLRVLQLGQVRETERPGAASRGSDSLH